MIQELVEAVLRSVEGSSVCELEYLANGYHVRLVRDPSTGQTNAAMPLVPADHEPVGRDSGNSKETVRAGMTGTFYRASGPDQPPLAEVGQRVDAGQQLGLIEAMKMLHAVEADCAGRIAEVLAVNDSPVEPGTPLFVIDVSGAGDV